MAFEISFWRTDLLSRSDPEMHIDPAEMIPSREFKGPRRGIQKLFVIAPDHIPIVRSSNPGQRVAPLSGKSRRKYMCSRTPFPVYVCALVVTVSSDSERLHGSYSMLSSPCKLLSVQHPIVSKGLYRSSPRCREHPLQYSWVTSSLSRAPPCFQRPSSCCLLTSWSYRQCFRNQSWAIISRKTEEPSNPRQFQQLLP